jgi:hypothetical protein
MAKPQGSALLGVHEFTAALSFISSQLSPNHRWTTYDVHDRPGTHFMKGGAYVFVYIPIWRKITQVFSQIACLLHVTMDRGMFAVCANVHLEIVLHCLEKGSKMAVMLSVRECAGKAVLHTCLNLHICLSKEFLFFILPPQTRFRTSSRYAVQLLAPPLPNHTCRHTSER